MHSKIKETKLKLSVVGANYHNILNNLICNQKLKEIQLYTMKP